MYLINVVVNSLSLTINDRGAVSKAVYCGHSLIAVYVHRLVVNYDHFLRPWVTNLLGIGQL